MYETYIKTRGCHVYATSQKILLKFLKEVSYAQGCIYLIKK